jgi:hypothetical protein
VPWYLNGEGNKKSHPTRDRKSVRRVKREDLYPDVQTRFEALFGLYGRTNPDTAKRSGEMIKKPKKRSSPFPERVPNAIAGRFMISA